MSQKKYQTFTYHVDFSIPPSLIGDRDRLGRVIGYLLDNAVKFTPEQGEIRFAADVIHKSGRNITLQIEVADNGISISEVHQSKLFDLFEQVDGGTTRQHGGIGLGLPLAKRIIEVMEGTIRVDSELGKGAKFTFTCKVHEPA
jgi:signal transduction histidine kinase